MKNKILIAVFIILVFVSLLSIFYFNNNCYSVKITVSSNGLMPYKVDNIIASELKDKISQVEELKEIVFFSKQNTCSVYIKFYPFILNKYSAIEKVQKKLNEAVTNIDFDVEVVFDDSYDVKYDTFIVISSNEINYKILKKYTDEILDKLLALNISKKTSNIGEQQQTTYIYYKNSVLQEYDLSLEDILNLVADNNIINNATVKTNSFNSYNISVDTCINSIDDVKNIAVYYKNKKFSTKLGNIFNVADGISKPSDLYVKYDDKKSQILAIAKKDNYPYILYYLKLKKFKKQLKNEFPNYVDFNFIKTDSLKKIDIYFKNKTSIYNTLNEYNKIYSNAQNKNISKILYFIGADSPKIKADSVFSETQKNKLTVLLKKSDASRFKKMLNSINIDYISNKTKKIYIENNNLDELYRQIETYKNEYMSAFAIYTDKTMQIDYNINPILTNSYKISKKEILNSIQAYYDGLYCGYYYNFDVKTNLVLSNDSNIDTIYFYSKDYKNLISLDEVTKSSIHEDFIRIVRKNDKYFGCIFYNN